MANFFTHKTDRSFNLDNINERAAHYSASQKKLKEICALIKPAEEILLNIEAHVAELKGKLPSASGSKKQDLETQIERNEQCIADINEKLASRHAKIDNIRKGLEDLQPLFLISQLR